MLLYECVVVSRLDNHAHLSRLTAHSQRIFRILPNIRFRPFPGLALRSSSTSPPGERSWTSQSGTSRTTPSRNPSNYYGPGPDYGPGHLPSAQQVFGPGPGPGPGPGHLPSAQQLFGPGPGPGPGHRPSAQQLSAKFYLGNFHVATLKFPKCTF